MLLLSEDKNYLQIKMHTGHRKGVAFLMNFEAYNGNNLLRQFLDKGQSELYGI